MVTKGEVPIITRNSTWNSVRTPGSDVGYLYCLEETHVNRRRTLKSC